MKQAAEAAASGLTHTSYAIGVVGNVSVHSNGAEASPVVATHSKTAIAVAANVSAESSPFLGSQNTGDNDEDEDEEESNTTPTPIVSLGRSVVNAKFVLRTSQ